MEGFAEGYAVGQGNSNNYGGGFGGAWGSDWLALLVILALFGSWGNNGNGGWGGNNCGCGCNNGFAGYEIGKLATTNDVASGFSTSAIMSNQRDMQLANQQGFSNVQQTLCQGFSGVNATVTAGTNTISNAICNLGYNTQSGFNALSSQIAGCCCDIEKELMQNRFLNEKQTCDIIQASNANTQRIVDMFTNNKLDSLRAENAALTAQLSQNAQTRTIIDTLLPVAKPAYLTCSPYQSAVGYNFGWNNNSCGCGCGCGF